MAYLPLEERMGVSRDDYIAVSAFMVDVAEATKQTDQIIARLRSHPEECLVLGREFLSLLELVSKPGAELAIVRIPDEAERRAIRVRLAAQDPKIAAELRRRGEL